jgi:hypothetical protein
MAGFWANSKLGTETAITSTLATANGQLLVVYAPASTIPIAFVNEWDFGASGAPNSTDCAIIYQVYASSTAPTAGTLVTAGPDNAGNGGTARTLVNAAPTATNTIGAIRMDIALNQRATFRWTAIPGQELATPATAGSGWGLGALSATYNSTIGSSVHFFE